MRTERCCIVWYFFAYDISLFIFFQSLLIVFHFINSLCKRNVYTQVSIKISEVNYFSFSSKLNEKKKVSLEKYGFESESLKKIFAGG